MKLGLDSLELLCEGEVTLAERIKIKRFYKNCKTHPEGNFNCFLTEMTDITVNQNYKANVAILHGMAQCSDAFFETALQFVLNGFRVIMVDLHGFGYTSGTRVIRMSIEGFHH